MKKILLSGFALMILLQTTMVNVNAAVERPKGKKTVYENVSSEIKDMLDSHDFGAINTTDGNVVITYYVDHNNLLHIKDIGSKSQDMKDYVIQSLEGKEMHAANLESFKDYTVKLHFALGSN